MLFERRVIMVVMVMAMMMVMMMMMMTMAMTTMTMMVMMMVMVVMGRSCLGSACTSVTPRVAGRIASQAAESERERAGACRNAPASCALCGLRKLGW